MGLDERAQGAGASPDEPVLKRVDAWWTVLVVDPVAVRFTRLILHRPMFTPMRLTVTAHLMGLVTALLFLDGRFVWAAVLFEVRFVLDCADGKLARLRGTASERGAFLDYVGDYVVVGANLVGVALWLVWEAGTSVVLGVVLPASFLLSMAVGQSAARLGTVPFVSDAMSGGYRHWMAARRMKPVPSRIDVEHGLLFVLPLLAVVLDQTWPMVTGAVVATTYFTYVMVRLSYGGYQLAARSDRS